MELGFLRMPTGNPIQLAGWGGLMGSLCKDRMPQKSSEHVACMPWVDPGSAS